MISWSSISWSISFAFCLFPLHNSGICSTTICCSFYISVQDIEWTQKLMPPAMALKHLIHCNGLDLPFEACILDLLCLCGMAPNKPPKSMLEQHCCTVHLKACRLTGKANISRIEPQKRKLVHTRDRVAALPRKTTSGKCLDILKEVGWVMRAQLWVMGQGQCGKAWEPACRVRMGYPMALESHRTQGDCRGRNKTVLKEI